MRAVNSQKDLGWNDRRQGSESPPGHFISSTQSPNKNSLHLESWQGLIKAGVHVKEQEVDVSRKKVLNKLNMLNDMSSQQIEEFHQENLNKCSARSYNPMNSHM